MPITPSFPAHTGPHKVGTVDVELPVNELQSPSVNPAPTDIPTVAFRIFYPCKQESSEKHPKWIPNPQRDFIKALTKFMGAGNGFATAFSFLPHLLNHTVIPVHPDADILAPSTTSNRWPVMIFSHGLGGSRNAYSHICGSLASHGLVVVAPEHRDGSAMLSVYKTLGEKQKTKNVEYKNIPHDSTAEVYEERDEQLRIRMWELGLIHDALLKIDAGSRLQNLAQEQSKKSSGKDLLSMFSNLMDIHEPGSIAFAGHSFGACTTVQFMKTVYYHTEQRINGYMPLYEPSRDSSLVRQITPATPVTLLDIWTLPIQSPDTEYLRMKPMPCYDSPRGGKNLLSILSEAFYNWSSNYREATAAVAKPSRLRAKYPDQPGPYIFYPVTSAHLSQSDFGILFPWVTTKVFGAKDPARLLRLNTRAILQLLRDSGFQVADTNAQDLEIEGSTANDLSIAQDTAILSKRKDVVPGWESLSPDSEGGQDPSMLDKVEVKISVGAPMDKVGNANVQGNPPEAMF